MARGRVEDIVRNKDRAVPKPVPFGKTLFRILVTQPECSHGSSLFYEQTQSRSSCRAELKIPIYNINWNHVLSSGKTL